MTTQDAECGSAALDGGRNGFLLMSPRFPVFANRDFCPGSGCAILRHGRSQRGRFAVDGRWQHLQDFLSFASPLNPHVESHGRSIGCCF